MPGAGTGWQTPRGDLAEALLAAGCRAPAPPLDPTFTALATEHEPPAVDDIQLKRVETFEDFLAGLEIELASAAWTEAGAARRRADAASTFERRLARPGGEWLALLDGEPVAIGERDRRPARPLSRRRGDTSCRAWPRLLPRARPCTLGRGRTAGNTCAGGRRPGLLAADSRTMRLRCRLHGVRGGVRPVSVSRELREYAEMPDRFAPIPAGSSVTRFDDGRVCVLQGADLGVGQRRAASTRMPSTFSSPRCASSSPRQAATWWIGPSSRPGRPGRTAARAWPRAGRPSRGGAGARADEGAARPTGGDRGAPVETFDDFVAAREVQWDAFEVPEDRREQLQEPHPLRLRRVDAIRHPGRVPRAPRRRVAATALAIPSERGVFLIAGSTAPWARGRGLYRALVRARWDVRRRARHAGARHPGRSRRRRTRSSSASASRTSARSSASRTPSVERDDVARLVEPRERLDDRRVELRPGPFAQPADAPLRAVGVRGTVGRSSSRGTRRRRRRSATRAGSRSRACRPGTRVPSQRSWHARTIGRTSASRSIGARIFSPSTGCSLTTSNSSSVSGPGFRRISDGIPILPMSWKSAPSSRRFIVSRSSSSSLARRAARRR